MAENKGFDILDIIILVLNFKRSIFFLLLFVAITTYTTIYFYVDEQFEGAALILPTEQDQLSTLNSIMKNFSGMTSAIGASKKATTTDLYTTIINSRTTLTKVINTFGLFNEYKLKSMEKTIEMLRKNISIGETNEKAFTIAVKGSSRQKAADMTNYIVDLLNKSVIDLNIKKATDNKNFIEQRYNTIKKDLKIAEDSLAVFQSENKLFEVEAQAKTTFEQYAKLDASLAEKETQQAILEKILDPETPQLESSRIGLEEFKKKVESIKSGQGLNKSVLIPFSLIAQKSLEYFRLFRNVKIQQTLLEFIVPVYEQSKLEEQKSLPVFQVVDSAIPPEKRVYPKRVFLTSIVTISVVSLYILLLLIWQLFKTSKNEKLFLIKKKILNNIR